jgi:hypothetical protein
LTISIFHQGPLWHYSRIIRLTQNGTTCWEPVCRGYRCSYCRNPSVWIKGREWCRLRNLRPLSWITSLNFHLH